MLNNELTEGILLLSRFAQRGEFNCRINAKVWAKSLIVDIIIVSCCRQKCQNKSSQNETDPEGVSE